MKYVVGNWKMNLGTRETVALIRGVLRSVQGREQSPSIIVCPSFTALAEAHKLVTRTRVELGAQNAGLDRAGAFTGEIGLSQLEDVGCKYALVGHSERRTRFHEDDALVRERLTAVLASDLTPILCVGESQAVRKAGEAENHIAQQLKKALAEQKIPRGKKVMIAYEPIWAIGTGTPATPAQALEMHRVIRSIAKGLTGVSDERIVVLYGGSVDKGNAYQFLREPEVDGVLVGGASLKIAEFHGIIMAACDVMDAQADV